ncbi:putative xanthine dehydrogenase YagR molybdenum-binding subunit [Streptomyces afghaniensis 772] [Streptomyces afghaniensis]
MTGSVGALAERREGREKVSGTARYAAEYHFPGRRQALARAGGRRPGPDDRRRVRRPRWPCPVCSPSAPTRSAPRLAEPDDPRATLAVLQDPGFCTAAGSWPWWWPRPWRWRGLGAAAVRVDYAAEEHDVALTASYPGVYVPEEANGG